MYRDITKTNKNVQRHYKDKQNVQRHYKYKQMIRDITKTNKNVQRHYKDKQKCTETLQRQTKMYRDTTNTNTNE